jgi:NADPH:quinone reductase-like Zn-dependent oxidoreductase
VAGQAEQPAPGPGEILVRVIAAGVTPTELEWYPTSHLKTGEPRLGAIPGHEFSGVVEAAGSKVTGIEPGQEIYGMNDWFAEGALAEYCLTQPGFVAPKPRRLTHAEAASVPIGALTAWQGLFDRARLDHGEHILVHGGAGAVGVYAIQLAWERGARVTATVSARNMAFASGLGASRVIDYRAESFEEAVSNVDVVFDTVGGETLERSWAVLAPGGRLVTIAAGGDRSSDSRVRDAFFVVEPSGAQLSEIGRRLDSGILRPVVDSVIPFDKAPHAAFAHSSGGPGRGKRVIRIDARDGAPAGRG